MKKSTVLLYVLLTIGSLFLIFPFLWMLSTSLKDAGSIFVMPPRMIPEAPTTANYSAVLEAFPLIRMLFNSLLVGVSATLGLILVSSLSAYAFARLEFRGKEVLFMLYLGTMMVPTQVTLTPLFILMSRLGWANTYQALILPGIFNAFGTFLMRQFIIGIPRSLDEAAFIDGANHWQIFSRIILPSAKPAMASLGIFGFMASWNNYLWPLIITVKTKMMTLPLGLATLQGRWETDWNLLMAGTVISILPILIVYLFAQKYIIQGLSQTGIK